MTSNPRRLITADKRDDDVDASLRPQRLSEFIGQEKARANLSVFIEAARSRQEALDHVLFVGPPGLGKTTLAQIVARELGVNFRATSGPVIAKAGDLAALLTNLEARDVLFIDEIHRLNPAVEEILYPAMEDFQLDLIIGGRPARAAAPACRCAWWPRIFRHRATCAASPNAMPTSSATCALRRRRRNNIRCSAPISTPATATEPSHDGTVDFLDNRLDVSTGTLRGRAVIPNKDLSILPGQFGRVRLIASAPYEALLVPDGAVATDQARKIVFVVKDDNTVEAKPVTLGPL